MAGRFGVCNTNVTEGALNQIRKSPTVVNNDKQQDKYLQQYDVNNGNCKGPYCGGSTHVQLPAMLNFLSKNNVFI
jgi:hypothetical protein